MPLHVLRHIEPAVLADIHRGNPEKPDQSYKRLYLDANKPWFASGYVDANAPRSGDLNEEIMVNTDHFAVWEDENGVIATFSTIKAAEAAKASARTSIKVDVEMPEPPAEPDPEDAVESGAVPV